jgi:hypothetical protein
MFLAAHRWILRDETPPLVILISGGPGAANRRLAMRQKAHAAMHELFLAQLPVSALVRGRAFGRIFVGCARDRSSLKASKQLLESNGFFMSPAPHPRCLRTSD